MSFESESGSKTNLTGEQRPISISDTVKFSLWGDHSGRRRGDSKGLFSCLNFRHIYGRCDSLTESIETFYLGC